MKTLAINGGEKAITRPLSPRHAMNELEKNAVMKLFDDAIAKGENIGYGGAEELKLCEEFSEMMGGGYADGVNGGTNSVYVALRTLNPEPFSEVIVGAVTDPGGMMPILMCNCIPVVADTVPGTFNASAESIESLITPLTAAIIVAHIGGEPADMRKIMAVADKHNIPVIEDCAQSHFAKLDGKPVGSFGKLGAFSTMFGKHFNTGGQGGIVFTKEEAMWNRIRGTADRGKPFGLPEGSTNWIAAINCNLNDIGAAIGRVQLKKVEKFCEDRRKVVEKLAAKFPKSIVLPELVEGAECAYWFLRVKFNGEGLSCTKDEFTAALVAEGLPMNPSYKAALPSTMTWFKERRAFGTKGFPWTSPEYKGNMNRDFEIPNAIAAVDECFNISINESWTDEDIELAAAAMNKVDKAYRK